MCSPSKIESSSSNTMHHISKFSKTGGTTHCGDELVVQLDAGEQPNDIKPSCGNSQARCVCEATAHIPREVLGVEALGLDRSCAGQHEAQDRWHAGTYTQRVCPFILLREPYYAGPCFSSTVTTPLLVSG